MNKDLLYRFFEGKISVEDEKIIRQWSEQSKENQKILLEERINYDVLLFTPQPMKDRQKGLITKTLWIISTAVAMFLFLFVGGIYLIDRLDDTVYFNTINVPAGQRTNIVLADNSNIWLNANTTFRYPSHFSGSNRTVYLNGEAYFEVSKDEKKPFVVKTGKADIYVTGTSFNVEAYSQFDSFETSLFEGEVDLYRNGLKLESLKPNEKATLKNDMLTVKEISDTDVYLWRHGLIAFNSVQVSEILHTLEKYFGVVIQFNAENLPQHTYNGKFRQADGVDYALKVLQKSVDFKYKRDEETGIIYIN